MSIVKSSVIALSICVSLLAVSPSGLCITPALAQTAEPQFAVIALEGDPAPPELGGTYSKIESSSVGNSGEVAFSADISGSAVSSALFLNSGGTNLVVLRSGDSTPAGGTFKAFHEVDIADGDFLLFRAELQGIPASEGVFLWYSQGGVQTIQLAGDQTNNRWPGMTYKSFSQLTVESTVPAGPFNANYAFVATLAEGQGEAVVWNEFDTKTEPLTVEISGPHSFAAASPKEIVDHFVLARLGNLGLNFVAQYHKVGNSREFSRPFYSQDEGELQYDQALREGLQTTLGKLKHMDVPVAVDYSAQVFLSAEFVKEGQRSKAILTEYLACCSSFPLSALLLTGDPAPGHHDQTIADIGPPVANPVRNPPSSRLPSGLVSAVQLSDGRNALWVAVLTPGKKTEFKVNANLALVGGATGDPSHPVLSSFNPVKLTDTGKLLVNGSVGSGAGAKNGVFVLSGLF